MRIVFSSASAAQTASRARPIWGRGTRSATAFWLPAAAVLALTVVLMLLWPHNRRRTTQANSMPEASVSYVLLEGSYGARPSGPFGPPWPSPSSSTLPEPEDVAARRLPSPEYTSGLGAIRPWAPMPRRAASNAMPNLASRPVAGVLTGLPPAATGPMVTLSAGLLRSGFHFEIPPGVAANLPVDARFQVELDDKGNVIHLLMEPNDNPAGARLLETAISQGHGARAGSGQVQVSWGR